MVPTLFLKNGCSLFRCDWRCWLWCCWHSIIVASNAGPFLLSEDILAHLHPPTRMTSSRVDKTLISGLGSDTIPKLFTPFPVAFLRTHKKKKTIDFCGLVFLTWPVVKHTMQFNCHWTLKFRYSNWHTRWIIQLPIDFTSLQRPDQQLLGFIQPAARTLLCPLLTWSITNYWYAIPYEVPSAVNQRHESTAHEEDTIAKDDRSKETRAKPSTLEPRLNYACLLAVSRSATDGDWYEDPAAAAAQHTQWVQMSWAVDRQAARETESGSGGRQTGQKVVGQYLVRCLSLLFYLFWALVCGGGVNRWNRSSSALSLTAVRGA